MPGDFWGKADDITTGMTLNELSMVTEGRRRRTDNQMKMLAWHAANLMNCWVKKGTKITPEKLLGNEKTEMGPAELQEHLREKAAKKAAMAFDEAAPVMRNMSVDDLFGQGDEWVAGFLDQLADDEEEETTEGETDTVDDEHP